MEREPLLTERIRQAIDSGKLPARKPDRVLGGPGTGNLCAVCGAMLTLTQMEIEVEFDRGATCPGRIGTGPAPGAMQHGSSSCEIAQGLAAATALWRPSGTPCRHARRIRHWIEASLDRELPWHDPRQWARQDIERLSEK